jgi:sugar lactone lactonase YvrE
MSTRLKVAFTAFTILLSIASTECTTTRTAARGGGAEASAATAAPAAAPATVAFLTAFDPAAGELPEGVATKEGSAYVGFAPLGEIAKVDLRTSKRAPYAKVPRPVPGKGFMTGLTFGPDGLLYAALVSFDPSVQPGIYRIPASGGEGALFAKDAHMVFPNGLAFDARGTLFVTDSAAGAVYKIAPSGAVGTWVSSALLAGDQNACGGSGNPFPIGANGIAERHGAFFVTNTDKGSVLRVNINQDGTAGAPEIAAGPDCRALAGADGLTVDTHGSLVIAVNRQNKMVRLPQTGAIEVVAADGALDFPASVTWDGPTVIATNFALANASSGKPAKPGLLRITTERP